MRNRRMAFCLMALFCLACGPRPIQADEKVPGSPSAQEILARAADVYQKADTYQDQGVAITEFKRVPLGHRTTRSFTTAFSRKGQFRFEFWEVATGQEGTRYVVWKHGDQIKSWWTVDPKVESHTQLGDAISGATGVSGGTAYTIPSILMKEAAWKGCTWTCSERAYRIGDGVERGIDCYRVQRLTSTQAEKIGGTQISATQGKLTHWIAKDSFLLIREDEETSFHSFSTHQTVQYKPQIDQPVQATAFEFGH